MQAEAEAAKQKDPKKPEASDPKGPASTQKPPPDKPAPKPKPVDPEQAMKKKCALWLLLAKNFYNQKQYDKAEEHLKRVLENGKDEKILKEARELMAKVDVMKKL
jgi:hypothetical protein